MADILIRGVEMPNNCEECPFNDYEQGFCFAVWKFIESGWPEFSLNVGDMKTRHPQCPLVQLPEGHGRLIDADAFEGDIRGRYCHTCDNYNGLKCKACWVDDMLGEVDDAPTIVPAEGD